MPNKNSTKTNKQQQIIYTEVAADFLPTPLMAKTSVFLKNPVGEVPQDFHRTSCGHQIREKRSISTSNCYLGLLADFLRTSRIGFSIKTRISTVD
jgi:hypothetical protein